MGVGKNALLQPVEPFGRKGSGWRQVLLLQVCFQFVRVLDTLPLGSSLVEDVVNQLVAGSILVVDMKPGKGFRMVVSHTDGFRRIIALDSCLFNLVVL